MDEPDPQGDIDNGRTNLHPSDDAFIEDLNGRGDYSFAVFVKDTNYQSSHRACINALSLMEHL